jgi:hypothetical protein
MIDNKNVNMMILICGVQVSPLVSTPTYFVLGTGPVGRKPSPAVHVPFVAETEHQKYISSVLKDSLRQ